MIRTVLTFRPGSIGDCLMGKYMIENVRARYPEARCTLAVPTRVAMVRDLFAAYPWLEVVETRELRLPRRDVAVTPYTSGIFPLKTKLFARLLAKKLVGFTDRSPLNRLVYTKVIPLVGRARAPRLLECDTLAALSVPVAIVQPSFQYLPQPQLLGRLGLEEKKYVVLHLFSGGDARGLSPERKRALIEALAASVSLPIVLTGSRKETATLTDMPPHVRVVETTLQELAHLIDHAAAMVSLDTGAAHIAAHLRKPLVVLASCVGVQWWSEDMYGTGMPSALFTRLDVCIGGHDYSGFAQCLNAIDPVAVAARAAALIS